MIFSLAFFANAFSQVTTTAVGTWVGGDSILNQFGIYGTKGVSAPTNEPGSREGAVSWTDALGNFWLMGGYGNSSNGQGDLNDLWKYNPTTGFWTWVSGDKDVMDHPGVYGIKGVATATNKPGSRNDAVSWIDPEGSLWLMGGIGYIGPSLSFTQFGDLNDLWKYNPNTGFWTWMSGDNTINRLAVYGTKGIAATANKPGARRNAISWADAFGNLWLMGGFVFVSSGVYARANDLWKYNISTGYWTWVSGDNIINQYGFYGTKGITHPDNKPGARSNAVSWIDPTGNLWLMGGEGYAASGGNGYLNDLWKYNPIANLWTWVSGDNITNSSGSYGTKGVANAGNKPSGKHSAISWIDGLGNLWLMGGGLQNDLWKYNPSTGYWTWVSGDATYFQPGIYGTKGVANSSNKPGARQNAISWIDASGNLWLMGGYGYSTIGGSITNSGYLNDLWKLDVFDILPVTLLNFSAVKNGSNILIQWSSAVEQNTSHYDLEHSIDGNRFNRISRVTAAGNSNIIKSYSFTDHHPLAGTHFYRLKMVDADDKFSYSKVVAVNMNATSYLQIFPNPANNILFVQASGENENASFQIVDITGKKLKEEKIVINGAISISIDISNIPRGTYTLILQKKYRIEQKKFLKQ